jgi:hypothetical protein
MEFTNMSEFLGSKWLLITDYDNSKRASNEYCRFKWKLTGTAAPYDRRRFEQAFPNYTYTVGYVAGQGTFVIVQHLNN